MANVYASLPLTGPARHPGRRAGRRRIRRRLPTSATSIRTRSRRAAGSSAAPAERTRFFRAQSAPIGSYGYEAMALILDAVAEGGGDREATVRAARATTDRDSVLGRYSLDEDATTTAYGQLAVVDGELVSA